MEKSDLIKKIEEILKLEPFGEDKDYEKSNSYYWMTLQFVRNYIGKETEFYNSITNYPRTYNSDLYNRKLASVAVLKSIKSYLELDLDIEKTHSYNLKTDVINDFIEQTIHLSNNKKIHPAAPAILLGAALEEFLKQLADLNNIDLKDIKPTINPISQKLYEKGVISKQDVKDITSWAGLRNDATHGNFEEVNDRKRILNAIEGVNLFIRKHMQ